MKYSLVILFVLLLFVSCKQEQAGREHGSSMVYRASVGIDPAHVLEPEAFSRLNEQLLNGIRSGSVAAYVDDSLVEVYVAEEIKERLNLELVHQYAPDPGDPEYLVDTIIQYSLHHDSIRNYMVAVQWNSTGQKFAYKGNVVGFALSIKKHLYDDVYIEYPLCWMSLEELKKFLPGNSYDDLLKIIQKGIFEHNNAWHSKKKDQSLRNIFLDDYLGKFTIKDYNYKMFGYAGHDGALTFKTDRLKEQIGMEDILMLGRSEEVISYAPFENEPDYFVDTIIAVDFEPYKINSNALACQWQFAGASFTTEVSAFGPAFPLKVKGMDLGNFGLFYLRISDLNKVFSSFDIERLDNAIFREMVSFYGYEWE